MTVPSQPFQLPAKSDVYNFASCAFFFLSLIKILTNHNNYQLLRADG